MVKMVDILPGADFSVNVQLYQMSSVQAMQGMEISRGGNEEDVL